ncbi:ubiquinol-cytochrome c reductase iron-sulfur subunit [Aquihabitans sp. G128]|uniref:ubiquinol-cytochrome c reductase iron-sulfur subunit n=1 Tax=Aquihabitans sp. G128 TaxID=2849779 RepID=UPI001C20FC9A|nr:ubiquinol-cytochrome c reductase iron-sulfur subunit [Aquihabitans sp. G128]QXC61532.1 ubiquinol-cytochrome c reductase iron-sulfur subunit [Aquihabitans sp. G128]
MSDLEHDEPEHDEQERSGPPPTASAEVLAAACFLVAALAAIGLGVVYWQGGQTQLEGLMLAVATGGIGVGIVVWAKRFMPHDEVTEERESLASTQEEIDDFRSAFEHGEQSVVGRRLLLGSAGAALTALGAALLFPIRSLGPRPGKGLKETAYSRAKGRAGGVRLVRADNSPLKPEDLAVDGVLTVFPEDHTDDADSPTLVIRTRSNQKLDLAEGRDAWVVDGIIAYSKLCTHVGCPVGLYQAGEGKLLCPCHQSTFNVLEGAKPIFGPAARPLPQLPLGVDDDGYLIATDDFSSPVGPGFWDRDR